MPLVMLVQRQKISKFCKTGQQMLVDVNRKREVVVQPASYIVACKTN